MTEIINSELELINSGYCQFIEDIEIYKNFSNKFELDFLQRDVIEEYNSKNYNSKLLDNYIKIKDFFDTNEGTKALINELKYLKILSEFNQFPKILFEKDRIIYLKYYGKKLNKYNIPINWENQLKCIFYILSKFKLNPNNFELDNLYVFKNEIIFTNFEIVIREAPNYILFQKLVNSIKNLIKDKMFYFKQ